MLFRSFYLLRLRQRRESASLVYSFSFSYLFFNSFFLFVSYLRSVPICE